MPLEQYKKKRDFSKTPEPAGKPKRRRSGGLQFVIQKHAASHLHYDLRLEMGGVMKSWAVPKGPSLDPKVRRLAMEVEDHPIEYNDFEGTIPKGEYGGGTVMLWDRGTYEPDEPRKGEDPEATLKREYEKGKISFTLHGERLRGSFALVRTDTVEGGIRSKWLFFKHRDEFADPSVDITDEVTTSVASGRTMEEIAAGEGGERVWHSNRGAGVRAGKGGSAGRKTRSRAPDFSGLEPMLARTAAEPPTSGDWIFEPKYDGIRVLAVAAPGSVALVTRNGHDKARQFPEVAEALEFLASDLDRGLVLDGEIVPVDEKGRVGRFELLQGRMHVGDGRRVRALAQEQPAAIVCFDVLLEGDAVLVNEPWTDRRERLEALLDGRTTDRLRISEVSEAAKPLVDRGKREGWEGVMAKRRTGRYLPGQRSHDWLKIKLENQQELVVGGWTEPRKTRSHLGAILLGYYDAEGRFIYAGHTGTGFTGQTLAEMYRRLKPLERKTPPFTEKPKTNEKPHWTTPKVVVQVKFNEWTRDGKLRQPVFLGFRDDKEPTEVVREPGAGEGTPPNGAAPPAGKEESAPRAAGKASAGAKKTATGAKGKRAADAAKQTPAKARKGPAPDTVAQNPARTRKKAGPDTAKKPAGNPRKNSGESAARSGSKAPGTKAAARRGSTAESWGLDNSVVERFRELAETGRDGQIDLGDGVKLSVTSLRKVFYPQTGHTKGDLFIYYARMADYILPWMEDRPLVLKRFPNGVEEEAFYQQAAPSPVPKGVRVETVKVEGKRQRRLVGGNLATLLYTVQLGAISYDPWHSRITDLDSADYTILDLDPGPEATFQTVIEVARRVREEMDALGLEGALKTSGSSGLHVYLPLPPGTPLEAATLVAQIVATRVARKHPGIATVERMTRNRPPGTIYVDYLQNILGKTVAGVYAARAKPQPTVATPLAWHELTDDLDLREFTIDTVPARIQEVGDLWAPAMNEPNSLERLMSQS